MRKRTEKKLYGYIYCHTFPNGKKYVGQTTTSIQKRFGKDGKGYSLNPLLWKAIQKYGWDNVIHEILEEGLWSLKEINQKEQYYISKYNTRSPSGYNLTRGGDVPICDVQKIIQIDRISLKPLRTFESLTEAAKEVNGSVECICQCCRRKTRTANGFCWCYEKDYDANWSPANFIAKRPRIYCFETDTLYNSPKDVEQQLKVFATKVRDVCKKKLSVTHGYHFCYEQDINTYIPKERKDYTPVICITTGEEFSSIAEASRKTGCNYTTLKKCLKGEYEQSRGLRWKYKEGPRRKYGTTKTKI